MEGGATSPGYQQKHLPVGKVIDIRRPGKFNIHQNPEKAIEI